MSRLYERDALFLRMQQRLAASSGEYNRCMHVIAQWQSKNASDPGSALKTALANNDVEAEKVNDCRSVTKDFWRMATLVLERAPCGGKKRDSPWVQELVSRHADFVKVVQPIDVLDGYSDDDRWVYRMFSKK